jgi:hypothetical protein
VSAIRALTRLVRFRGWLSVRYVLFAALALVLAMAGGATLRQAQAQQSVGQMRVNFSASTPPLKPGVICKDQDYQIVVQPMLSSVGVGQFPVLASWVISLTRPDLGTLNGSIEPAARHTTNGGVAVFTYRAQRTGQEKLNFGWTSFVRPGVSIQSYEDIDAHLTIMGDTELPFEVQECAYNVTFASNYQFTQSGLAVVNFGFMPETPIQQKEDGTFAGNGTFVISQILSTTVCVVSYSDVAIPISITGKLLEDSGKLELNFAYGKGTQVTTATCPRVGTVQTSTSVDISGIAPSSMKFSQEGETKTLQLPGPGRGKLTITVKPIADQ